MRRTPGVNITEIDETQILEGTPTGVPAGIIGTAARGPAFVPVKFSDFDDWVTRYGAPESRFGPIAVNEWLRNGESALYMRLLGVGNGQRSTGDGNVREAGFVVGTDRIFEEAVNPKAHFVPAVGITPAQQTPGRVFFLGALHEDRRSFDSSGEPVQDDLLYRAGIDTTEAPKPVVRGVLMTPRGVVATLLSTSSYNVTALDDVAPEASSAASYGNNPGDLGGSTLGYLIRSRSGNVTSRLLLNGHKPTPENPNEIDFSFDPKASNYLTKAFNTDPERIAEAGHCLYAWWEVDTSRVRITGERVFAPENIGGHVATLGAFCIPGHEFTGFDFDDDSVNYENFESRYTEPVSPWILSEELSGGGSARKRLFRLHTFDSGENANTSYKIAISNIVRSAGDWTRFDVTVRSWSDTDTRPVVIEAFPGCTLDPESENYISRRIGDSRLKYVWEADPQNQGLRREGFYRNRSRRVWVEVTQEVEDGLATKDHVPCAHEGLPHVAVDGWNESEGRGLLFWDDALLGAPAYAPTAFREDNEGQFPGTSAPNEVVVDVSNTSVFDLTADAIVLTVDTGSTRRQTFTYTTGPLDWTAFAAAADSDPALSDAGVVSVSYNALAGEITIEIDGLTNGTFEIYTAEAQASGDFAKDFFEEIRQAPVPFRENIRTSASPSSRPNPRLHWGFKWNVPLVSNDGSLSNWSKFFPSFGVRKFWSLEADVAPDSVYETVLDVNEYNENLFTLERIEAPQIDDGSLDPRPSAWSAANYRRDGDLMSTDGSSRFVGVEDFENPRIRNYLKFTVPVFGGFDGVNSFDSQRGNFTDRAVWMEREAGLVAEDGTILAQPVNPDDPTNPLDGPTWTAWVKAAVVIASSDDVDVDMVATPGLKHFSAVDEICRLVEDRLDAFYIIDPEVIGDEGYTDDVTKVNLTATIDRWESRAIDNSFVGAYFPDTNIPTAAAGGVRIVAPASAAVLGVFAQSDALTEPWFAAAGVSRGRIPNASVPVVFDQASLGRLDDASINPIKDIAATGTVVWGNKTTRRSDSALNRINVRRLLIEIRRRVRAVGLDFLHEPGTEATLAEFQSRVNPIITDIKQKRGILSALVRIDTTTTTALDLANRTIRGVIAIQPTPSYEIAEIDFILRNPDGI